METKKLIFLSIILILIVFGICAFIVMNSTNNHSNNSLNSENLNGIDLEKLNKSSDSDLSENSNPNYYIDGEIIENRTVWDDGTPVDGEVYLVKKSDGRLVCYENGVEYPESYFY